jgi:ubiquinone/menaquinone biosynthesis C-methylase UbiE
MATVVWGKEIAEVYDLVSAGAFEPAVLNPTVDFLAALVGDGAALEFAVGTGRVALPLAARGVVVRGIELSPHMADQLGKKPGSEAIEVTVGDMATTKVAGSYNVAYLVANTIMNVTTQDEQVAVFENAAAHLEIGGTFVLEYRSAAPPPASRGARPGICSRVQPCRHRHLR